jgi:hypothetical protein
MTMLNAKAILVGFAVLALCAVGSSAASAATKMSWFVGGKALTKGENVALASKAVVDSPIVITAPGLGLEIKCTGYNPGKSEIQGGEEMGLAESNLFEGCSVESPSNCQIQPPRTIGPGPMLWESELVRTFLDHYTRWYLRPRTGNKLGTIDFEGEGCALTGEQALTGSVDLKAPSLESEEATQPLEALGTTENNSLELAGNKAYIASGKILLKLASGSKWSFHE